MGFFLKDPQSRLDYRLDWADRLGSSGTLAQSQWSVHPAHDGGLAIEADGHDAMAAHVTISGGLAGRIYDLTNRVTLDNGITDARSLTIRAEAR